MSHKALTKNHKGIVFRPVGTKTSGDVSIRNEKTRLNH